MADNLLDQATQQYPVLNGMDIGYKENFGGGEGWMESYPPGETGSPEHPRPAEFKPDSFGVEVYNEDSQPSDLMADITSHHLINTDDTVKSTYQNFTNSIQPFQKDILADQYDYAKKNEGETRPYEAWEKNTGLPGYLRGYTFGQWPKDFNDMAYTPEQRTMLDGLNQYLKSNKGIGK